MRKDRGMQGAMLTLADSQPLVMGRICKRDSLAPVVARPKLLGAPNPLHKFSDDVRQGLAHMLRRGPI